MIDLPADVFFNTTIPTIIMILKKDRTDRDVFFIDASKEFERIETQNILQDENIERILDAYFNKEDIDKFSHLASYEEIKENDYNLNIPRYVDTFEPEPDIPLEEVSLNLKETEEKLKEVEIDLFEMLKSLEGTNLAADNDLKDFIQSIGDGSNG